MYANTSLHTNARTHTCTGTQTNRSRKIRSIRRRRHRQHRRHHRHHRRHHSHRHRHQARRHRRDCRQRHVFFEIFVGMFVVVIVVIVVIFVTQLHSCLMCFRLCQKCAKGAEVVFQSPVFDCRYSIAGLSNQGRPLSKADVY